MEISLIESEFFNDFYCDKEMKKEIKIDVDNMLGEFRDSIDMLEETLYLPRDDLFDIGLTPKQNEKGYDRVNDKAKSTK